MAKQTQTTRDFVVVSDIRDNIAILKDGSLRSVVEVSSTNFELKSLDEQTALVSAFQGFLNSIDFPLQVNISSRKLDIIPYLKSLDTLSESVPNELMKIQSVEYARFIKGLTELANIMSKKFYIVIPLFVVESVDQTNVAKGFFGVIKSAINPSKVAKTMTDQELENYRIQLSQRIQFVMDGISSLGLESKILNREELMNLYYSYYNPGHHL